MLTGLGEMLDASGGRVSVSFREVESGLGTRVGSRLLGTLSVTVARRCRTDRGYSGVHRQHRHQDGWEVL